MKSIFAAAMLMTAMIQVAHAQDVAAGEQSFKKCFPCHSIGEGAKNKVGPELNGLDGRHSGSAPAVLVDLLAAAARLAGACDGRGCMGIDLLEKRLCRP